MNDKSKRGTQNEKEEEKKEGAVMRASINNRGRRKSVHRVDQTTILLVQREGNWKNRCENEIGVQLELCKSSHFEN